MIPVLVLTHGDLASELLQAAETIDPSLRGQAYAMPLPWDVDSDEASRSLKKQLRELDEGEGTLVLTDMFGGTATNLALPFLVPGSVEVITDPQEFEEVRDRLHAAGWQTEVEEVTQRASTSAVLGEGEAQSMIKLLEMLEDLDDVQNVYSNADIPDDILAAL